MSKPNGRQKRAIENLASALNECFDANFEVADRRFDERFEAKFDAKFEKKFEEMERRFEAKWESRFDRQDATLRMIWRQCGGSPTERLPIDE